MGGTAERGRAESFAGGAALESKEYARRSREGGAGRGQDSRQPSSTEVPRRLIELVLATTQYRGNARVITAAQQMLDELLNLRR